MRIQILGTAAAEAWPGLFCGCDTCRRARAAGGKDLRSRASLQIDDAWKVDLPPDTYLHLVRHGLDFSRLRHLFITHSHHDHFAWQELEYVRPPFAHDLAAPPITLYGNDAVRAKLDGGIAERAADYLQVRPAEPFVPIAADGLTFTPILASHAPPEQSLNYVIQSLAATVLYASDTGLYPRETMAHLARYRFDLLIVECTQGLLPHPSELHMGWGGVLRLRDDLAKTGAVAAGTGLVITHFSHNIGLLHDELQEAVAPEGAHVAYDGMILEV